MTESDQNDLEDLRSSIDRIDNAVVDLLLERMDIIETIGRLKQSGAAKRLPLRPAREAQIIRRLVERAGNRLPAAALARMWHELLAATSAAQQPFEMTVMADQAPVRDLARDQFGSMITARPAESPHQALRMLREDTVQLAVLPVPGESDDWWCSFAGQLQETPFRVIGRLPMVRHDGHLPDQSALAIADVPFEASGDDLTLVMIELASEVSRARLRDLLLGAGMTTEWLASRHGDHGIAAVHLVEVSRFYGDCADALAKALGPLREDLVATTLLGGYPRPLATGTA